MSKVVLITGAGRGIGAATAHRFAAAGYSLMLTSRTQEELHKVQASIAKTYPSIKVLTVKCDIANENEVHSLFKMIAHEFGTLDVCVNNAGYLHIKPFIEQVTADWDRVFAVNIRGMMFCCREAFKMMKATGGSIVNISSLAGLKGLQKFHGFSAYTASKFAVVGLSEALAVEGKEYGIRVNCVAPGAVNTRMLEEATHGLRAEANPEDIAESIFFLADGQQSGKVSGTTLEIHSNAF